jgi:hypothetical protein
MKKENIYVEITNEQERLRAIEILQNAGEEICKDSNLFNKGFRGVIYYNNTEMSFSVLYPYVEEKPLITLDELETLLNPKKSNVFTEVQEWVRDNTPELSWVFTQKEEPECFKLLKEHLKNDYPKGTEIKISKDKIEIYHS